MGEGVVPDGEAGTRAGGGIGPSASRGVGRGARALRGRGLLPRRCPPPHAVSVPPLALLLAPCSLSTSGASDPISGHLNWPEDLPPDRPPGAALCGQGLPQHAQLALESCPGPGDRESAPVWGNWPLGRLRARLLCPAKTRSLKLFFPSRLFSSFVRSRL